MNSKLRGALKKGKSMVDMFDYAIGKMYTGRDMGMSMGEFRQKLGLPKEGYSFPKIKSFKTGGTVKKTGIYKLHRGERVVPVKPRKRPSQRLSKWAR